VGYEEGGQLTERIRRKPYSVVLLDEIEKAHPEVFNILLQVLDDGRLTDGKGRTVDFRNTVIIMTSNVGAQSIRKGGTLGFAAKEDDGYRDMKDKVMEELKRQFRPEFLNRIDEVIVFHALTEEDIKKIVDLMVEDLRKRLRQHDIDFELTEEAKTFLAKQGFDPHYGARPLKRAIQRHIEDRLSEALLSGTIVKGDKVRIDVQDGELTVRKLEPSSSTA
jgi:ATP-dependent Clp protease ATP-binding subunit ClpC